MPKLIFLLVSGLVVYIPLFLPLAFFLVYYAIYMFDKSSLYLTNEQDQYINKIMLLNVLIALAGGVFATVSLVKYNATGTGYIIATVALLVCIYINTDFRKISKECLREAEVAKSYYSTLNKFEEIVERGLPTEKQIQILKKSLAKFDLREQIVVELNSSFIKSILFECEDEDIDNDKMAICPKLVQELLRFLSVNESIAESVELYLAGDFTTEAE